MKKTITTILTLCIGLVSLAQTFCLQLTEVSNDGNDYVVKIEMQGSVPFQLGSGNLQFAFPENALGTPSVFSSTLAPPQYFDPSITTPLPGQASFNMELVFPGTGMEMTTAPNWTELAQISFPIVDAGAITPFAWAYNGGTTQTVVFADDEATQLFATSADCLVFTALEADLIRLTKVNPTTNEITISNLGATTVNVGNWRLCSNFNYTFTGMNGDAAVAVVSGDFELSPDESVTLTWTPGSGFRDEGDDVGLYLPAGGFGAAEAMVDFVQYLSAGNGRESVAVEKGIWTTGAFVEGEAPYNFNGEAADFGVAFWSGTVPVVPCAELIISEYGEPNGGNGKYLEIYNPTGGIVDLSIYEVWKISNGGDWPEQTLALSGSIGSGGTFVIANNNTDVPSADQVNSGIINFNGDDAIGLAKNGVLIDAIGTDGADPGSGFDVAGVVNGTANNTLLRKETVLAPNADWSVSAGSDEVSSEWIVVVYNQDNLGIHATECVTGVVDSDNDGVADADDNCPNDPNPNQENMDGDLLGDVCDDDIDGDGFDNDNDCDPLDNAIFEGATCDDGDANTEDDVYLADCTCVGTLITIDTDNDGVFDVDDNCPNDPNPNQENMDGDLLGDVCDDDIDGDGVLNGSDCAPMDAAVFQGATCDDGNPESIGDIILADCSCAGVVPAGDCDAMMISEYGEPDGGNGKYIEIFNASNADIDLTGYAIWKISNGGEWPEQTFDLSGTVASGGTFVIANNDVDVPGADLLNSGIINFNGDDAMALAVNGQLLDVIGTNGPDPGSGFDVAGIANATANNTLVRKSSVLAPTTDWTASAGVDEATSQWTVVGYNQDDLGAHASNCFQADTPGCINAGACNYNEAATLDDGSCVLATGCDTCSGETDGSGTVIDNPEVGDTCDDGDATTVDDVYTSCDVCVGVSVPGCIDEVACNFDPAATVDDNSCIYAMGCDVCDENGGVIDIPEIGDSCDDGNVETINDVFIACGFCAGVVPGVDGCTDNNACNFNSSATDEDGLCVYATGCDTCSGETDGSGTVIDNSEIGDSCDDGNENTFDDAIVDCGICSGQLCDVMVAFFEATSTTVFCSSDDVDDIFTFTVTGGSGENELLFATELDGTVLAALDIEPINFNGANDGEFLIYHMFYDGSPMLVGGDNIADFEGCFILSDPIAVSVISGDDCPVIYDCPDLMANVGDECDDGNDDLIPGIVNENCECIPGEVDCPALGLNVGDACDDGNSSTINDVVTVNCLCQGTEASDCTVVEPSIWGTGPWYPVTHGSFVAESANDAILATGDGELFIEVFLGECGGTSLGLYNTVNAGVIERVVVGDLIAGNTYSYTVHNGINIQSKVKTYADSRLEDFDCNVNQNLIDQIYALREETMYSNPAVQVTGFGFRFVDEVSGEVTELVDAAVDGFYQQLSTIPGLQAGHSYIVTVKHKVLQIANGVVATLWSDYGSECVVAINNGEGDFAPPVLSLTLSQEEIAAVIYPNPNKGDNLYVTLSNLNVVDQMVTVNVMDVYGKKVYFEAYAIKGATMNQELLFNNDIASGLYLVQISANGQSVTQKLIIE